MFSTKREIIENFLYAFVKNPAFFGARFQTRKLPKFTCT